MTRPSRPDESPNEVAARLSRPTARPGHGAASASDPWVPIRSLGPRHRSRIAAHLLALPAADRYLRFGYLATDNQLTRYVDQLDFEHDELFGIFNRWLELIAMAHLAHPVSPQPSPRSERRDDRPAGAESPATKVDISYPTEATMAEFGVSVLPKVRGRGLGRRMFAHAMLHARNRGVETLFIHALSENTAMLKIARNAGATVERHGSESQARLKLPPDTLSSHVDEMVEQTAAEFDYRLKRRARQVRGIFGALTRTPGAKPAPPKKG